MSEIHGKPVQERHLAVLKEPIVGNPSRTLLEVGFLSNPDLQEIIKDPKKYEAWVNEKALEIAKGIDESERSQGRGPTLQPVLHRSVAAVPTDPKKGGAKEALVAQTHGLYAEINTYLKDIDQGNLLKLDKERVKKGEFPELIQPITDLQANLNALGFKAGTPDGIPGDNTKGALALFEVKHPKPPIAAASLAEPGVKATPDPTIKVAPTSPAAEAPPAPTEKPATATPREPEPQAPPRYIPKDPALIDASYRG
jgi:hypothetical protein